jgi:hypothetical protein
VLVPGVADGDDDAGDDDAECADAADAVDVTDGDAAEPLVAAMATPAVPAPRPAARNPVRIRRRARPPPLMDVIWFLLPSPLAGQQLARCGLQDGEPNRRPPEA